MRILLWMIELPAVVAGSCFILKSPKIANRPDFILVSILI